MKVLRECIHCGKEFTVFPYQVRKGHGKFCSTSCGTTYRNIHNNPTLLKEVREKISRNHADVSGENNPMHGRRGQQAPSYIDGRNSYQGETYKKIALANYSQKCAVCKDTEQLEAHHRDGNHRNNELDNLMLLCHNCHRNLAHTYVRNEKGQFSKILLNEMRWFDEQ